MCWHPTPQIISSSTPASSLSPVMSIPQTPTTLTVPLTRHRSYYIHEADVTIKVRRSYAASSTRVTVMRRFSITSLRYTGTSCNGSQPTSGSDWPHLRVPIRIHQDPQKSIRSSWRKQRPTPLHASYGCSITRTSLSSLSS